ncbi:putative alkaline shock family protein YloU [Rhodococcus sp. 27YEA15]|uniref:Asp23/Gls24 family envelope stress response protein n=1 Tax=Rhodococcus sp. 27YEA15 TaxID=3156259 RepID=UPI003C7CAE4B
MAESVEPGMRGTLTVRDHVAHKLVLKAARETTGVRRHAGGIEKLTRRRLPRARVTLSGNVVHVRVDIAVQWADSPAFIGSAVRDNVRTELETVSGLTVAGVEVDVVSVLPPETDESRRGVR